MKQMLEKCPKSYLKWGFVVAGMICVLLAYVVYSSLVGDSIAEDTSAVVSEGFLNPQSAIANTWELSRELQ